MRIVLVDDDAGMRDVLRGLLAAQLDIDVVGDAGNGRDAIDRAHELEPAILLMDLAMPGMNGVEATRRVRAELPSVRVIGLSLHGDRQFVLAMLDAGASGYLLKERVHADLVRALRGVAAGGTWWPPGLEGSG